MTDDEKSVFKVLFTHLGSLAIALAFAFAFRFCVSFFGEPGPLASTIGLAIFLAIIFVDPVSAYFEIRSGKTTVKRCLYRMAVWLLIAAVFVPALGAMSTLVERIESTSLTTVLIMLPALLIMPVAFMMPLFERRMSGEESDLKLTEDAKIAAAFPIYTSLTMIVTLGTAGVLHLVGGTVWLGAFFAFAAILVAVAEAWMAEDDDIIDVDQTTWGDRAASGAEAWAGLKRAIGPGITSSVFMGSTIFMGLSLADFSSLGALDDLGPVDLLAGILIPAGIVLVVMISVILLAVGIVAAAVWAVARVNGADPLTMAELGQQGFARLLMGGMNHVRPDLETD